MGQNSGYCQEDLMVVITNPYTDTDICGAIQPPIDPILSEINNSFAIGFIWTRIRLLIITYMQ